MEEYIYIGNASFTQVEIDALEKAVKDTQDNHLSEGIHSLLEERARRSVQNPDFYQYEIDTYLEAKGLKSPDTVIPPRKLTAGYELVEKFIPDGTILPCWHTRDDGAIIYLHRWWSTTSPPEGWIEFAWFKVESALKYEQVSKWKPKGKI